VSDFVVDASVAIKWFVDEHDSAQAGGLLRHSLAAPDLLAPECASILWKKVTRADLSLEEAEVITLALEGAAITLHPTRPYIVSTPRIACDLGRAAYDCFYLALADRLRQPLVTANMRLVHAVRTSRFARLVVPLSELGAD
jgi:predicted nucleic acid-binding protein